MFKAIAVNYLSAQYKLLKFFQNINIHFRNTIV